MNAAIEGDRLYLVCHTCKIHVPLARVWPYSSSHFYSTAADRLTTHSLHEHEMCYEKGLKQWPDYPLKTAKE